ncbi:MAG: hypothetical protein AUG51_24120 [Acidobacteria bacterium 13_1_20CM_3_53_8]|nr:MAG: hypothetical protein AUG51_24120 [Acidobacteria bacterium 13_1_20CM_3_53_8]
MKLFLTQRRKERAQRVECLLIDIFFICEIDLLLSFERTYARARRTLEGGFHVGAYQSLVKAAFARQAVVYSSTAKLFPPARAPYA